jgi:hypothetical protein
LIVNRSSASEEREGERIIGHIQGKHGVITLVTPDRSPDPHELDDLYRIVVEISIRAAQREAKNN